MATGRWFEDFRFLRFYVPAVFTCQANFIPKLQITRKGEPFGQIFNCQL